MVEIPNINPDVKREIVFFVFIKEENLSKNKERRKINKQSVRISWAKVKYPIFIVNRANVIVATVSPSKYVVAKKIRNAERKVKIICNKIIGL